jgi:regulator of Ty1 transposition protein 103
MSGFTEDALEKKLADLNNSQQSIQQLSVWLIHHRKHFAKIVAVWLRELGKTTNNRKLTFLYLANDVVQNSRKKAPEFAKEFGNSMKKVLDHLAAIKLDEKTVNSIGRLLNIWQERTIFDQKIQAELNKIWAKKAHETAKHDSKNDEPGTPPLPKKARKGLICSLLQFSKPKSIVIVSFAVQLL